MAIEERAREEPAGLYTLVQAVLQQQQAQAVSMALMERSIRALEGEVASLARAVKDGNGRPSLLERSALMEKAVGEMATSHKELRALMEARSGEEAKGKWQMIVVVVTGILSLVSAVITALLATHK